ncbi:MAG: radical SAM protein [Desulfovibrio sp.]|nr:radical SAM protein [Desulfovibrio sp.]
MQFTETVMRPPQEAHSLVLQVMQGCTWNKCNFCYISRGQKIKVLPAAELELEAAKSRRFLTPRPKIYLAGSNPFSLSVRRLEEYLEALRRVYPEFTRVSLQARIDDIPHKSDAELARLVKLGLSHLYIGTENGNEKVLAMMNKGHTAKDTVEQLKRLDQAGMTYTNFYVLGLGGKGLGRESGEATAAMFNQAHPERITTTGLTLFPASPVAAMAARGEFEAASEREKIEELQAFLKALEIDTFYDGIHYLNPLHYRFPNADKAAKAEVLQDIEDVLRCYSEEDIERMVNRKAMASL